ncbi:major facilitator superfamily domain-containing protein 12-like isoform X1 [Diorhabda carinulata]|uniref:major facilitator superfamily domain-containing protein 12-like isoform X1 n=1 Tax=Diorhabda carinulata TaxID=1163345 RepID=UPI0025A0DAC6|nr:major facilitator superfamily domain-containing protein 12-like isoform X1 [Diorhabda carinulata]XP_057656337.1 major facilitator superfamily domain-containing protein 12-like isoform X1 [Diorhabda carinulata]
MNGYEKNMFFEDRSNIFCLPFQKLSYGLGHIFNDLCAAMWFSYTLFYLQVVLDMESTTAGMLLMIGQIVDSLATPAVGYCIDYTKHRRLWHLGGTIAVTIGFSLIFSIKPDNFTLSIILYYITGIFLFQIGWATVQISHLSIIPELSRSYKHSSDLTAIRYIASVCCNICVYSITLMILKNDETKDSIGPNDFYKFKEIAVSIIFIGLLSSMLFYCGLLGKYDQEYEPLLRDEIVDIEMVELHGMNQKHFFKQAIIYCVSIMYMCSRLLTTLNLIYIPLYIEERGSLNDIGKDRIRQTVASIPLTSYLTSFVTSLLLKCLVGIVSDKITYCFGSIIGLVTSIWIGVGLSTKTDLELYSIAALLGVTGSTTMVSSLCLTANFVKTNGIGGGMVYSFVTFTDKLISGSVVFIVQHLQCVPRNSCPYFYKHALTFICASVSLIAILALISLHIKNRRGMHLLTTS